jgi:hypothetical protein
LCLLRDARGREDKITALAGCKEGATQSEILKGLQQIAAFQGEPVSVVKRWATQGMPVQRVGRFVSTSLSELNAWLGKESGNPVHAATETTDLTAELKRGLSFVSKRKTFLTVVIIIRNG